MADANASSNAPKTTVISNRAAMGVNTRYLRTFHGIAKILEILFLLSAFISSLVTGGLGNNTGLAWTHAYGGGFVDAITIIGAVASLVLCCLCLLGIWWKVPLLVQTIIECIWYSIFVVFMLTCTLLCARFYSIQNPSAMASAIMCCLALVVFSAEATVALLKLRATLGHPLEPMFGIPAVVTSDPAQRNAQRSAGAEMQFNDLQY